MILIKKTNSYAELSCNTDLLMPPKIKIRNEMTDIFDNIHIHDVDPVALTQTWFSNKHIDLLVIPVPP